uniref:uncharacterized protein n=1 Tax=Myxine glutinosa TaxID=7769 RepID=UPI00358F44CD
MEHQRIRRASLALAKSSQHQESHHSHEEPPRVAMYVYVPYLFIATLLVQRAPAIPIVDPDLELMAALNKTINITIQEYKREVLRMSDQETSAEYSVDIMTMLPQFLPCTESSHLCKQKLAEILHIYKQYFGVFKTKVDMAESSFGSFLDDIDKTIQQLLPDWKPPSESEDQKKWNDYLDDDFKSKKTMYTLLQHFAHTVQNGMRYFAL